MPINEQQARQNLQKLITTYNAFSIDERNKKSESDVIHQFVDILLRDVLGWPIEDPARYRYEQVTEVGRPDMILTPETGETIFLEAKRFGIIKELAQARKTVSGIIMPGQMALPGMAVDRTREEQQAINYAFANNGTWAILTNFEKLRLFNARRDWLVLSFERPDAYLSEFDLLWELAYPNILTGSLDRLSKQRVTAEIDVDYLKFINEWRERLAQDIVTHRAENPWAFTETGEINLAVLRAVVQRTIDRLVIIRFAEDHLVVNPGVLRGLYDISEQNPYYSKLNQMIMTLFQCFDQEHNSALFSPGVADLAVFSDEVLRRLVGKLYEARYRSMPADIMGNTYEQYLGKTLIRANGSIRTADNLETRKKQGSYYTPQVIVRYVIDHSLGRYLYATENGKPDGVPIPGEVRKTSATIRDLRVLDGACGSGSFLIYAYEVLDTFYESEKRRIEAERLHRLEQLAASGVTDPFDLRLQLIGFTSELERIANHPRLILEMHLYGVDLDPQAAEIAVVNLMMRGMERRQQDKRLPLILNQNVKIGNALVGLRADDPRLLEHAEQIAALIRLRADLIRTEHNTPEHDAVIRNLQRETDQLNRLLTTNIAAHFAGVPDAQDTIRPFCWGIEFPEVFFDKQGKPLDNPGFTIIVGNPPWEILKPDLREFYAQFDENIESRLTRAQAEARIVELDAEMPGRRDLYTLSQQSISQTAAYVRASGDYTRQGRGDVATHKLFLERMYGLLRREGRIGFVVPSGIYSDLGTKELREMLLNEGNIQYVFSFSNERLFFPGVHHAFKFTLIGAQKALKIDGFWASFRFNPRVAIKPDDMPAFLDNPANLVYVNSSMLAKFSPDSLSLMEFQTQRDYDVISIIYDDLPTLGEDVPNAPWSVKFTAEFHVTNDRALFRTDGNGLPLYEGKMIHQYDIEFAKPQYWIDEEAGRERLKNRYGVPADQLDYLKPRLAYRGIAAATNEHTLIATMLPPRAFSEGRSATTVVQQNITFAQQLFLLGCLNSLVLDWFLRFRVSANVNMFHIYQLPVPRLTSGERYFDAIVPRAARLTCTRPEFADLWQQVMGEPWDSSKGASDPAERARLRAEIDGLVAHLYGLSETDFAHVLGTFPLVAESVKQAALSAYREQG